MWQKRVWKHSAVQKLKEKCIYSETPPFVVQIIETISQDKIPCSDSQVNFCGSRHSSDPPVHKYSPAVIIENQEAYEVMRADTTTFVIVSLDIP